jgi:hypothetical protein
MDDRLKADFEDVRTHTREAARSTLVAMRDGLDYLIRKLDVRMDSAEPGERDVQGDTQREADAPPVRDSSFDA